MTRLSRRQLLEESLLAAAMAAGAAIPSPARAAEPAAKVGPNQRLNVAVLGVRGRGRDLAKQFLAQQGACQITHICDADADVLAAYAKKLAEQGPAPKAERDMRRIFDDKSVDIVVVATPNHWHSLAAIWAMQAGKDVYVEKPVSHHVTEGRRMVQAARKYRRICQGGTQHRSNGSNRAAARYIASGKLGPVTLARAVMHRPRKPIGPAGKFDPPPSVDYNLWAGPAPLAPITRQQFHYDWHWFWDFGNGEIGNNNIHTLDQVRLMLGLSGLGRGVLSYGGRVGFHDAAQTANTQVAIHDFGSLTLVQEVRNLKTAAPRPKGTAILLRGREGYLAGGFGNNAVYDLDGKPVEKLNGPGEDHVANFLKAVHSRNRDDQNAEIEQGHVSTALVHLANISQRLAQPAAPEEIRRRVAALKGHEDAGETFDLVRQHLADNGIDIAQEQLGLGPWLELRPGQEAFVGNPAADALLDRQCRRPFVVPSEKDL